MDTGSSVWVVRPVHVIRAGIIGNLSAGVLYRPYDLLLHSITRNWFKLFARTPLDCL